MEKTSGTTDCMKRIAITGPECTGKSWLAEKLAAHFQTKWVPEYAREYIGNLNRPYHEDDLLEIARGQIQLEDEISEEAGDLIFCDTDLYVIKVWSDHKFGHCNPWIIEELENRKYEMRLLTYVDIPWEEDPQREHPSMRNYFYDVYFQELSRDQVPFTEIKGLGMARLTHAIKAVNLIL